MMSTYGGTMLGAAVTCDMCVCKNLAHDAVIHKHLLCRIDALPTEPTV